MAVTDNSLTYYFPPEDTKHEGTWLTWPHEKTYGQSYVQSIEYIWVEMVRALVSGERVHIIAYDDLHQEHIIRVLKSNSVLMDQVDFVIAPSDDVWVRDTGPMFVFDETEKMTIANFGFDGWGKKMPYTFDDDLPKAVADQKNIPIVNIPQIILEGGAIEMDGKGTAILTKSSVISENRNPGMSQEEAENYMRRYLGVSHFIWLEGVLNEDITDAHIDGFARFYDEKTLLTVSESDFYDLFENVQPSDYTVLTTATNAQKAPYEIIEVPLTKYNVQNLSYKGSYLNYYVANDVILLPIYNDPNDEIAIQIIQNLYPNKRITPINVVPLYKNGGMIHCITQQQPELKNKD